VDALIDRRMSDDLVARTVIDHGEKGGAADGMESDAEGRIYLTNYEHNAIVRRRTDGSYETLVHDPRVLWPDTLSLATDGYLYFTANQLHRQPQFHGGKDLRQRPYCLFRIRVGARPVLLR
jgi:sugar lactone lactonase YvrE